MTHDFTAEAAEFAKRIPDPPKPPANVIRFPTLSERWSRQWTRSMPEPPAPPTGGMAA